MQARSGMCVDLHACTPVPAGLCGKRGGVLPGITAVECMSTEHRDVCQGAKMTRVAAQAPLNPRYLPRITIVTTSQINVWMLHEGRETH